MRVLTSVSRETGVEDGRDDEEWASMVVWNSMVFIPLKEVGGARGARCAWWIGWMARTCLDI